MHVPPGVKVTVPVGVIIAPGEASVTIAVQVVAWLMTAVGGLQATVVEASRLLTVTAVLPLLVL